MVNKSHFPFLSSRPNPDIESMLEWVLDYDLLRAKECCVRYIEDTYNKFVVRLNKHDCSTDIDAIYTCRSTHELYSVMYWLFMKIDCYLGNIFLDEYEYDYEYDYKIYMILKLGEKYHI